MKIKPWHKSIYIGEPMDKTAFSKALQLLRRRRDKAQALLDLHLSSCTHRGAEKTHGSNTGNYDPSADCYWTDFHCRTCGRSWHEEGSK